MIIDAIRELNQKVPFEPYEIRMASGEKHRVPHPDFVLVSQRGNYVIVVDAKDRPHHLSTLLIEEAVVLNGSARAKAKRS